MARPRKPPRLYLHPKRQVWVVRDGVEFHSTGYTEAQLPEAEKALGQYLASKHKPRASASPLIADVLSVYLDEHVEHTKSRHANRLTVRGVAEWWGAKRISDITPDNCRAYVASKGRAVQAARRGLETIRAALNHWHKSSYGPIDRMPAIVMPPRPEPRDRWLTRSELAALLWAARRVPHLKRFIVVAYYTGSRSAVVRALEWAWIDFNSGIMRRRARGETDDPKKRRPATRIGRRLLAHLKRWRRIDGPAGRHVVHYDGRPLKTLRHSWENAVVTAGLDETVTPHVLRHTRVTHLLQRGATPWEVAGFVGMTPETVSRVYGHHSPSFQQRVADL